MVKNQIKRLIKSILGFKEAKLLDLLKQKGLQVGANFTMRDGCIIDFSHAWHITIGNNVTLAPRVHIIAHDASTWYYLGHSKVKNVTIGNQVFIGAGSIILPGVTIGDNVIVGAGSVVTKNIPDNSVYAGNPAAFIMTTTAYIAQEKEKMTAENCFDRSYSEAEKATMEKKQRVKQMAKQYGTAFVE